jgi:hypothetical protein
MAWPSTPKPLGSSRSRGAGSPSGTADRDRCESVPRRSQIATSDRSESRAAARPRDRGLPGSSSGQRFASDASSNARSRRCRIVSSRLELERIEAGSWSRATRTTAPER